ncbi:MAG: hypothetical protein QW348_06755 [Ignisphaera sp.]
MSRVVRSSKKNTICISRDIAERLGIGEGFRVEVNDVERISNLVRR